MDDLRENIMPHEIIKTAGDAASAGIVFATLSGWMPVVAALMSAVWVALRIYEIFFGPIYTPKAKQA
jgi:hypothetical protein